MKFIRNKILAEENNSDKRSFEEKGDQHFVGKKWSCDIADCCEVSRSVCRKLKRHGNTRDNPYAKGNTEHLHPKIIGLHPFFILCPFISALKEHKNPCQTDCNGRKKNVNSYIERELQTRQKKNIIHRGRVSSRLFITDSPLRQAYSKGGILIFSNEESL